MGSTIRRAHGMAAGLGVWALLVGAASASAQGSFTGMGHVPGNTESRGISLSSDGTVVVGYGYYSGTAQHAFRWTSVDGLQLVTTPGYEFSTSAYTVSGDGLVLAGNTSNLLDFPAWSWTEAGGVIILFNRGTVRAASNTGDVLAGYQMDGGTHSLHSVRWTAADGVRSLEPKNQTISHSMALGLSGDGALAVGQAVFPGFNALRAFMWDAAAGMHNIGSADPGGEPSRAWAITRDGTVVVGGVRSPFQAFRWTLAGGMQYLGGLPILGETDALAVSDDGNTIVGTTGHTLAGTMDGQAFIWRPSLGLLNLQAVLGPLVPSGWNLMEACGVSADGTVITGWGRNSLNQVEGWVAHLPQGITAVGNPAPGSPAALTLAISSNPVRGAVRLTAVGAASAVRGSALTITDATGRVVRQFAAGGPDWSWDSREAGGTSVPAGVYFAVLRSESSHAVKKLVVVR